MVTVFNPELGGHGRRVALLADAVALRLDLTVNVRNAIHHAALFHDIGMLGIARKSLFTPWEHLSETERNLILGHPDIGKELLKSMPWYEETAAIVAAHHEHWDGSGFPLHLGKESIPLEARIITVCDAFDEMTHKPQDATQHFSKEEALAHIKKQRGGFFDPRIVDLFINTYLSQAGLENSSLPSEVAISLSQLRSGMCLTQDLCNSLGKPLLTKGTILQEAVILRLLAMRDQFGVAEPIFVTADPRM
ncbi:HD-GYP domain-containing protein [Acidithiobacillus marinus]|uniref:HD-GYP domain-containing protein n=1 Tax=Acidithiobacillus marinus TaxID=187490 RepID=UPI0034A4EB1F